MILDGVEVRRQRRDGTPVDYSIHTSPLHDAKGRVSGNIAVLLDITERRRNEMINGARIHLMQFAATHSLDELLEEAVNEAEKVTDSRIGFYHFVDDDQQSLTLQNWSTRTKARFCKARGKGLHYPIADGGVWADCVRERKPVVHNDYMSLTHRKGLPEGHAESGPRVGGAGHARGENQGDPGCGQQTGRLFTKGRGVHVTAGRVFVGNYETKTGGGLHPQALPGHPTKSGVNRYHRCCGQDRVRQCQIHGDHRIYLCRGPGPEPQHPEVRRDVGG